MVIDEEERKLNYPSFGVSALEEHREGHSWNTTVSWCPWPFEKLLLESNKILTSYIHVR